MHICVKRESIELRAEGGDVKRESGSNKKSNRICDMKVKEDY